MAYYEKAIFVGHNMVRLSCPFPQDGETEEADHYHPIATNRHPKQLNRGIEVQFWITAFLTTSGSDGTTTTSTMIQRIVIHNLSSTLNNQESSVIPV